MLTKKEIQARADKLYPIIPLETRGTSSEILNDDDQLENFRLSIQSVSSNMAYVHGYTDAQNKFLATLIGVFAGAIIGVLIGLIFI